MCSWTTTTTESSALSHLLDVFPQGAGPGLNVVDNAALFRLRAYLRRHVLRCFFRLKKHTYTGVESHVEGGVIKTSGGMYTYAYVYE